MQSTIDRLSVSKREFMASAESRGRVEGAAWAAEVAEYGELQRLSEYWSSPDSCETDDAFGAPGVARGRLTRGPIRPVWAEPMLRCTVSARLRRTG